MLLFALSVIIILLIILSINTDTEESCDIFGAYLLLAATILLISIDYDKYLENPYLFSFSLLFRFSFKFTLTVGLCKLLEYILYLFHNSIKVNEKILNMNM